MLNDDVWTFRHETCAKRRTDSSWRVERKKERTRRKNKRWLDLVNSHSYRWWCRHCRWRVPQSGACTWHYSFLSGERTLIYICLILCVRLVCTLYVPYQRDCIFRAAMWSVLFFENTCINFSLKAQTFRMEQSHIFFFPSAYSAASIVHLRMGKTKTQSIAYNNSKKYVNPLWPLYQVLDRRSIKDSGFGLGQWGTSIIRKSLYVLRLLALISKADNCKQHTKEVVVSCNLAAPYILLCICPAIYLYSRELSPLKPSAREEKRGIYNDKAPRLH